MRQRLRLGLEVLSLLIASVSWGANFWGQSIAGHDSGWTWIAAASSGVFAILAVAHIAEKNSRIATLEDKRAVLSMRYEQKHPYWFKSWGYRIGLRNDGPALADHVEVRLVSVQPEHAFPSSVPNPLPSRLIEKGDSCERDHCVIRPKTEHYYDLLQATTEPGLWLLKTVEIPNTRISLIKGWEYEFRIEVRCNNQSDPVNERLVIKQLDDNRLDIELGSSVPSVAATQP
jgi:hypothetical protein